LDRHYVWVGPIWPIELVRGKLRLERRENMAQAHYAPAASRRGFRLSTRDISVAGILGALATALGYTPLGFIAFPTPAGSATTMHIPVIVAGVLAGPVVGAFVGAVCGVLSLLRAGTPAVSNSLIALERSVLSGVV